MVDTCFDDCWSKIFIKKSYLFAIVAEGKFVILISFNARCFVFLILEVLALCF